MKRSKAMRLVLVGSTPLMLAGCGQSHPGYLYRSEASCIAAGVFSGSVCQQERAQAESVHQRHAPRYLNQQECEADFGAVGCEPVPGAGIQHRATVAGYLVGREPYPDAANRGNGRLFTSQPLYRAQDDIQYLRSACNRRIGDHEGPVKVSMADIRTPASPLVSRGGFGASAYRYSNCGS